MHPRAAALRHVVFAVLLCGAPGPIAGVLLQPTPAPDWSVSAWLNDDPGSLRDQRGRVVLIEFVRLPCPECRSFLIPLFRRWSDLYGSREDVLVVSVVSAVEGGELQPPKRVRELIGENAIRHAVGIDAYDEANDLISVTMRRYRTAGTPHLAVVDRQGLLRFSHSGLFDPLPIEAFIGRLLEEPPGTLHPWSEESAGPRQPPRSRLDARLSGTYVFGVDRATGVCQGFIPRLEVPAELRVYRDSIDVEFARPFLGLEEIEARYDPDTGHVEAVADADAPVENWTVARREIRLEGVLDRKADSPQLEFELSIMDGKCAIRGRARR